jgi:hypothetical protein
MGMAVLNLRAVGRLGRLSLQYEGISGLLDEDCGSRSPADILSRSFLPVVERSQRTL